MLEFLQMHPMIWNVKLTVHRQDHRKGKLWEEQATTIYGMSLRDTNTRLHKRRLKVMRLCWLSWRSHRMEEVLTGLQPPSPLMMDHPAFTNYVRDSLVTMSRPKFKRPGPPAWESL